MKAWWNSRIMCTGAHVLMCSWVLAQSTGKLRLNVEPIGTTEYIVDDKYRMRDREITLEQGAHHFQFWAPERRILDTTLTVVPDRTTEVSLQLRYSKEFVDHRQATERYTRMNRWGRIAPPILAAGFGAWSVVSYINYKEANDELVDLEESYGTMTDPYRISTLKDSDIPAAQDEFAKARTQFYVSTGLFVASLGAMAYLRHRFVHKEAPVFEDKEKVRFDGLVWQPMNDGRGTWAASITIPIR